MQTEVQIKNRFSSTHQPKVRPEVRGPYLTSILKRFLEKKIKYIDPETNEKIKGKVKDAVMWRLILNACQGENEAIKEVLERTDGKVPQKQELSGNINFTQEEIIAGTNRLKALFNIN